MSYFKEYLIKASEDKIIWGYVEDDGDYQGCVVAIGKHIDGQIIIFEGYYGSCGGCGAWGEGGEPVDYADIIKSSKLYPTPIDAFNHKLEVYSFRMEELRPKILEVAQS